MKATIERSGSALYASLNETLLGRFYTFPNALRALRAAGAPSTLISSLKNQESLLHGLQGEFKYQSITSHDAPRA